MPSAIATQASGYPFPIISGNYYSGLGILHPIGGVQMKASWKNSGYIYVGLSGGGTITSGGFLLSGINATDMMELGPGDPYFIPKCALLSGTVNIYLGSDAACSGQGRLFWEFQ